MNFLSVKILQIEGQQITPAVYEDQMQLQRENINFKEKISPLGSGSVRIGADSGCSVPTDTIELTR